MDKWIWKILISILISIWIMNFPKILILISPGDFWKISTSIRRFRNILILIRGFWKIAISIKIWHLEHHYVPPQDALPVSLGAAQDEEAVVRWFSPKLRPTDSDCFPPIRRTALIQKDFLWYCPSFDPYQILSKSEREVKWNLTSPC